MQPLTQTRPGATSSGLVPITQQAVTQSNKEKEQLGHVAGWNVSVAENDTGPAQSHATKGSRRNRSFQRSAEKTHSQAEGKGLPEVPLSILLCKRVPASPCRSPRHKHPRLPQAALPTKPTCLRRGPVLLPPPR